MARAPRPKADADVDAYAHETARRRNIPTAENQGLVPDAAPSTLKYPRNPDLDPQLVWRGKDAEDAGDLSVPTPPIYIQEKIAPAKIIADLKRRAARTKADAAQAAAPDLFHDFNGLPPDWKGDATASYYHDEGNWQNRMILGDSLLVMAILAEREGMRGRVQVIYLDPPYGIKFNSNWQPSTKSRDVKDGKAESVSREPEVVRAFRDTWKDGVSSYLSYLRDRLTVARDLLTESGSIFVQIGDENVHLVRSLLDEVFGRTGFVAQIQIKKSGGATSRYLAGVTDFILWFAKDVSRVKVRPLYIDQGDASDSDYGLLETDVDLWRQASEIELAEGRASPAGRLLQLITLTSQRQGRDTGQDSAMGFAFSFRGKQYRPTAGRGWTTTQAGMSRASLAGRVAVSGNSIRLKRYLADAPAQAITDFWDDLVAGAGRDKTYVVQTASRVVARCLLMATDPGDLVLDPTCGSGTTAYVAEQWGRRWITIDTSRVALALARTRLMAARYDWYLPRDSAEGAAKEAELTAAPVAAPAPGRRPDLAQGFVYERAPRVTLKSIANNPAIDTIHARHEEALGSLLARLNDALGQGWREWEVPRDAAPGWPEVAAADHATLWATRRARQAEIDASIAANADVELLYDRPYKAKGVVRVTGPFTVESLSPHRVLPVGEDPLLMEALGNRADPEPDADATDFAAVVFENLRAAGVQNTKRGEAIQFEWLKPFASKKGYVAFEGLYLEGGEERRAAIAIGPEYDTVGYEFVRAAAREARDLFDTLIVCGFAFAPEVDDSRLNFGALTVLKARMNQDLRMGDRLKATGAGNLFVVFGEPDIAVEDAEGGMIRLRILGVDIFDPASGEVRSSADPAEDIACWFIDDDYDEESFFVRQAYFLGRDPYESLKRALKAEIDEAAWAELNATVSRPFARPPGGRVCVKVINHFGDEVQKVFTV